MPGGGWVATYEDATERRRAEERIAFLAHHDALTGLPNRNLFRERAEQAVADLGRGKGSAVLCLDLDRLKAVNDTLGHGAGDQLLRAVAGRLTACARDTDTVARLGGDEFAVVQAGVDDPEDAELLAERILQALAQPYDLDGHRVVVGASLGIALAPRDGAQGERLLRCADTALYRAKTDGRGVHRFFEPEMDTRLLARRTMELDLRRALGANELELLYQPLVNLRAGRVCGFEALLRWRHPERGMVSPAEFIPVAEETGLIIPIGAWALRRACLDASAWPEPVRVAVNVSPVQFRSPRLVEAVAEALSEADLPASRLELEITESVMLHDSAATMGTLRRLHDLGMLIAMDDFGTGYSSLGYLRSFPFDKIKIDQSFIQDLQKEGGAEAIVRAITGLGCSLGMRTTAEGVETEAQLSRLRFEGCTEAQGYLFGRPGPAAEVPSVVDRINTTRVATADAV
jgi:diguanylate cyclase (GGDEF)-like protein